MPAEFQGPPQQGGRRPLRAVDRITDLPLAGRPGAAAYAAGAVIADSTFFRRASHSRLS